MLPDRTAVYEWKSYMYEMLELKNANHIPKLLFYEEGISTQKKQCHPHEHKGRICDFKRECFMFFLSAFSSKAVAL